MPWSCSVSEISTQPCRRCSNWKQRRTIKSMILLSHARSWKEAVEGWFKPHHFLFSSFSLRLVLPSSSQKWQKNQLDIKMYLGGVVQVWLAFLMECIFVSHFPHNDAFVLLNSKKFRSITRVELFFSYFGPRTHSGHHDCASSHLYLLSSLYVLNYHSVCIFFSDML